jgi:hypothetical protein
MGCYVSTNIIKGDVDLGKLKKATNGLAYRIYKTKNVDAVLIDVLPKGVEFGFIFQSGASRPAELPEEYENLILLEKKLEAPGMELAFDRDLINLNIELSSILEKEVLSFASDDDETDFCVLSSCGKIKKIRFLASDLEVLFENNAVEIIPLIIDDDDYGYFDLASFENTPFKVHPREKDRPELLHYYSATEANNLVAGIAKVIGLSSFDRPEVEFDIIDIVPPENNVNRLPGLKSKSWWKFWD